MIYLFILYFCSFLVPTSQTSTITLTLEGISNSKGNVVVVLYNNEEDYFYNLNYYRKVTLKPTSNKLIVSFKEIPIGTYAISAYHDEDENEEITTNIIGVPLEKYGYSNNKFGRLVAPKYSEVSFSTLNTNVTNLVINLK
ncbi:DUF2141 domain-containing protein [Flammeovirga kamogawensis]|uniref:DUF2141 domain-containing protein n=1 Tax=Flammeovirga kamogawensis TaxID=373891 RepID=A0ABX8GUR2_9BACT|nr:DUF2141 domain-containing protein [Flammeovirga kamogawensis]MBB6463363.1 uncharacterized protein (DUF2141 family) [Flammeovirga kamogawensis]QWG06665.1 DUF2141 domain-containing protein [Flammeovirga kamogawensis]TRX68487.1 DUF2141 domain-containing protein [Flammeovirga kamogawensis]